MPGQENSHCGKYPPNCPSVGLYQKLKYITEHGTTPASGTPRKNLPLRIPAFDVTPAKDMTTIPQRTIIIGKKSSADIFFIKIFEGIKRAVTEK